jgi:hypothetical protein
VSRDASLAPSAQVPRLSSPAVEPVPLGTAEIFQAAFEHAGSRGETFVPAGLAPTIPTLVTLLAIRVPDGPHGGFTLAQVRVSCRSGARARALVVATAVDASPAAAEWLAAGWGIGERAAAVNYERRYDQVRITAPWFDVSLEGPRPIGVDDVQYVAGLHPVTTDGGERLAQVELEISLARVERGRPVLHGFTAPERAATLDPRFGVAATSAVGSLTLPQVRFVLRPDVPAHLGTERIARPAATS